MTKAELLKLLQDLDDNAEVTVIDDGQNYCWDITEIRVCEDNTSEYKGKYADVVIDIDIDNKGDNINAMTTAERTYERIQQDLNTLASMLRQQEFDNYLTSPQDQCYNPMHMLKALQKAQNSVEDLKQYVMGW